MALEAQQPAPAAPADEDFTAAFEQFSKDEKPAATETQPAEGGSDGGTGASPAPVDAGADGGDAADPAPVVDGGDGVVQPGEGAAPGAEPVAGAEPAPAAEAAAEPPAPAAEPEAKGPSADDILNRLAEVVREKPVAEKPAAEPQAEEAPPLYNADETSFLEQYEKDWTDVSRAEDLKRRQFGRDVIQYVFEQIHPHIAELKSLTDTLANRAHFTDLEQKVGPIDDNLSTQVEAWVGKQPKYLQDAYKQVLTAGTVDEVADLVDRFKKETGTAKAAAPAPSKGGSELSEPAKQAAEALAPVSSKRSVIEQQDDPNDFGGAFAKFTEMFKD